MSRGYVGRILNIDLTTRTLENEILNEGQCRDFIGGYGLGAHWLFDRMKAGIDPLSPENILGLLVTAGKIPRREAPRKFPKNPKTG